MQTHNRLMPGSLAERGVAAILFLYPILLLSVRGGVSGLFFLLAAISMFLMFRDKANRRADSYGIAVGVAMASAVAAILLSQIYHQNFTPQPYDAASRFLLAIPIFMILRNTRPGTLSVVAYGFPLGAIAALITTAIHPVEVDGRVTSHFLNLIHFGDLALMLGFLSFFSINWVKKDSLPVRLLKVAGLAAGLYLAIRTGSRGGWAAIPAVALIWVVWKSPSWKSIVLTLLALLAAGVIGYYAVDMFHQRLDALYSDITGYSQGNRDTSAGLRFQIWKGALHLFMENPVFGVGPEEFKNAISSLSGTGLISAEAIEAGKAEVHNEIISKTVNLGVFGAASILSIHLVPLYVFARCLKSASRQARTAAWLGICLVTGFLIFGLTVEIFDLKMTATFYALTVAVLLAAATNRQDPSGE